MNNMAGMPNMNAMGGPVGNPMGTPMNMMNNGALGPQPAPPSQMQLNDQGRILLNTYIYDYFIRYNMFGAARAVYEADPQIKVTKDSPGKHRDENGNLLGNGLGDAMDTDGKDGLDQKRPDDLPAPNVPTNVHDSCFLYEWFCLFWDMFNSQKGKGPSGQVNQYVHHTQVCNSPANHRAMGPRLTSARSNNLTCGSSSSGICFAKCAPIWRPSSSSTSK
jgi:hypothetical protein